MLPLGLGVGEKGKSQFAVRVGVIIRTVVSPKRNEIRENDPPPPTKELGSLPEHYLVLP